MVAALAPPATAVINADDAFAPLWRDMTQARVVTFGLRSAADFSASEVRTAVGAAGFHTHFRLTAPQRSAAIELRLGGHAQRANALAAAAAAASAGATLEHIAAGLAAVRAVAAGCSSSAPRAARWLIDDSYNANPSSVRAGDRGAAPRSRARRWLVFGDMAELGEYAAESTSRDRRVRARRGIERLFATGARSAALAAESFGAGAQWFADTAALGAALSAALADAGARCACSVKGSRINRLERVVDALLARSRRRRRAGTDAVLAHTAAGGRITGLQCVLLPDAARDSGDHVRAGLSLLVGPYDDRAPVPLPDRPGGARRRAESRICPRPARRRWAAR